jgi:hypothetical protein
MNHESLINFIELASIVVAGGLGIAGTVTETKTKKGKLTKWGWVALTGIVLANSLSFIQTYFKKEEEMQQRLENAEAEREKAQQAYERYQDQIMRLSTIVKKSDSSLKQQFDIQQQTGTVLNNVEHSVAVQDKIFRQSETLTAQQKMVAGNIDRTLNPILPFKINLDFVIKADSNSFWLLPLTKMLENKIGEIRNKIGSDITIHTMNDSQFEYLKSAGLFPVATNAKNYLITPEYPYFKDLVKQFTNLKINMSFSGIQNRNASTINGEVLKESLQSKNITDKLQLFFNSENQTYYFTLENLPVYVSSDLPTGAFGLRDLENSGFSLAVSDSPGFVLQSNILFKFPPDFSRINYIKSKAKGINRQTQYNYFNYTYNTKTHFGY